MLVKALARILGRRQVCARCGAEAGKKASVVVFITAHHVFPRRWNDHWTPEQKLTVVWLCRHKHGGGCHDLLERILYRAEVKKNGKHAPLLASEYERLTRYFLRWHKTTD